jgi:hypothetical protein
MANKNPFGSSTTQDKPYAVYKNDFGWEWRVLKTYQRPDKEPSNKYARWFVAATSPHMHEGGYELGDTYIADIMGPAQGYLLSATDEWKEHYKGEVQ